MKQQTQKHKSQTTRLSFIFSYGYSLIELMLVLAIIAVLLVLATRYYSTASSTQKVNAAADMLQVVINASEDVIGFIYPIHCGGLPIVVNEFISKLKNSFSIRCGPSSMVLG